MLSRLSSLTLCRSIGLLVLLARSDAAKDLERLCCVGREVVRAVVLAAVAVVAGHDRSGQEER